jgi:hypothetical protein
MTLKTTYRRVDGLAIEGLGVMSIDMPNAEATQNWLSKTIAVDYIEEQFDKQWRLVRHRTIRLGADEECENRNEISAANFNKHNKYCVCKGTKVKPRDPNPTWIEAA